MSVACGLLLNPGVFILSGTLAFVLGLGIVWPWLTMYGIRCELAFEGTRAREGEPVRTTITLTNRWPWPAWGLSLVRGFVIDTRDAAQGVALSKVSAWDTAEFAWEFIPECRGIYPVAHRNSNVGSHSACILQRPGWMSQKN